MASTVEKKRNARQKSSDLNKKNFFFEKRKSLGGNEKANFVPSMGKR
jgi:hypothetical protein